MKGGSKYCSIRDQSRNTLLHIASCSGRKEAIDTIVEVYHNVLLYVHFA